MRQQRVRPNLNCAINQNHIERPLVRQTGAEFALQRARIGQTKLREAALRSLHKAGIIVQSDHGANKPGQNRSRIAASAADIQSAIRFREARSLKSARHNHRHEQAATCVRAARQQCGVAVNEGIDLLAHERLARGIQHR